MCCCLFYLPLSELEVAVYISFEWCPLVVFVRSNPFSAAGRLIQPQCQFLLLVIVVGFVASCMEKVAKLQILSFEVYFG